MAPGVDAATVIELLELEPHPTCGYVTETYRSRDHIAAGGLPAPFAAGRPVGSGLYFLVTPDRGVQLHCIRNDQLYHAYAGDPLELLALYPDGTSEVVVVGTDLVAGQRPQHFLPGSTFHTARVVAGGAWFLGGSTEWPGVEPPDVEPGDRVRLAAEFPAAAALLDDFLGPG
jgi:predicted cupin superfamily sugar epimerase